MRIAYRPAATGSSTSFKMLADESVGSTADRISGYQPRLRKNPMVEPLIESISPFISDVGNGIWTVSFGVERIHESAPAALVFLATHGLIFQAVTNFDLRIEVNSQTVYLANCVLIEFVPNPHSDKSTFCRYTFTGGTYSITAP